MLNTLQKSKIVVKSIKKSLYEPYFKAKNILIHNDDILTITSIPESSIRVYESEESIKNKIKNSYCPAGDSKDNPVLQLMKHIVFPVNESLKIERDKKFGGDLIFKEYKELEADFINKKLHPMDLKNSLAKELIEIFKKPRKYFEDKQDVLNSLGPNFL